jgi:hypothetical protein
MGSFQPCHIQGIYLNEIDVHMLAASNQLAGITTLLLTFLLVTKTNADMGHLITDEVIIEIMQNACCSLSHNQVSADKII